MPFSSTHASLEIDEDIALQRRGWFAERCAWIVMAAMLMAAALGLFSEGPLSRTSVGDVAGTFRADYGHMQRLGAPTTVKLLVSGSAVTAGGVEIDLFNSFRDAMKITDIQPAPVRATALADRMRLRFAAIEGHDAAIYVYATPEKFGRTRVQLGLAGADPLALPLLVYP